MINFGLYLAGLIQGGALTACVLELRTRRQRTAAVTAAIDDAVERASTELGWR